MASIIELIKNIRNARLGKDVRESIASAIEQTYEDASKDGNANMEVFEARGTFDTLNDRLNNVDLLKADRNEVQNQIESLSSGSPKGSYSTISALITANPESGVYVVQENGHIYSWTKNADSAIDLGLYQSAVTDKQLDEQSTNSISNKTVTKNVRFLENNNQSKFIKFLQSNLNLNFEKGIPLRFFRATYISYYNYGDDKNRACTDKFSFNGTLYVYNFAKIRFNIMKLDKTTGEILERAKNNYNTVPYFEYEVSSDYDYIFVITNLTEETTTITDENIKLAEENLFVMINPLNENDITKVSKRTQLFEDIIDNYYVDSNTGNVYQNANMCYCEYKNISPRTKIYWNNCYTQIVFYDIHKNYISGLNYNPATTPPTKPFNKADVPNYAFYIRVCTRKANKSRLVISEVPFALHNNNNNNDMIYNLMPKNQIKDNNNQYLYNLNFKSGVKPDELTANKTSFSTDGLTVSSNGYARYNLFTCIDKSINKFIFKTDNNSSLRFSYDVSPYSTMSDACLIIEINTQTKLMNVYKGTYSNLSNKSLIGTAEIPFDFDSTSEYCIKISKETIYKLTVELFNSNCPNEVCTFIKENTTGVCRCWGAGRADCISGTLTIVNMSFISTGEKYPKIFVIGDSYVENYSRDYNASYVRQLYTMLDGKVFISGQGGATSTNIISRYAASGTLTFPQYTIFNTGVNDRNITFEQYQSNLENLISYCEQLNSIPILVTCPRVMDTDNLNIMRQINNFVRNSGYKYIDLAYILSTGDGETQDENKYQSDKVHPNENGANAIIKWIEANLPELIY